ncbi:class I glutamine amidotransferase-like protein [Pyrenochaeta sp. DS3sAY3a]|nr:class I glutamine amidotransferase-like protein [Pyrenochaeta sp. DS3sAY3a]
MGGAKVLIMMADYGQDPTETAVPYTAMTAAGFAVHFATESGQIPACDRRMLEGLTQKFLGATRATIQIYNTMVASDEFCHPLAWDSVNFSLEPYDMVLFPGGHDKGIRQLIDSPIVHRLMVEYFPKTKKPSKKAVAAICHGVMALSNARDADGKSPIRSCTTTALPSFMESFIYWGTFPVLGDYYKTYGAGSANVEESVRKVLDDDESQWKGSKGFTPFVVEDANYNYITARFPNDADLFGKKLVDLLSTF